VNNPVNILLQYQNPEIKDNNLLSGVKNGEKSAFRELFDSHKNLIFSTSLRMLKDASEAEDVTQEVFLRVFRNINQFEGKSSLRTWILKIAVNLCVDKMKSWEFRRSENSVPIEESFLIDSSNPKAPDISRTMSSTISSLPINTKTVFVLRALQGLKHEEISYVMGISIGTSKSQYSHARSLLRKRLGPYKEALYDEL
jgi:RNA polymerase sigma-70 factor (ECF subfamily)